MNEPLLSLSLPTTTNPHLPLSSFTLTGLSCLLLCPLSLTLTLSLSLSPPPLPLPPSLSPPPLIQLPHHHHRHYHHLPIYLTSPLDPPPHFHLYSVFLKQQRFVPRSISVAFAPSLSTEPITGWLSEVPAIEKLCCRPDDGTTVRGLENLGLDGSGKVLIRAGVVLDGDVVSLVRQKTLQSPALNRRFKNRGSRRFMENLLLDSIWCRGLPFVWADTKITPFLPCLGSAHVTYRCLAPPC
jgi:hypothetical protein